MGPCRITPKAPRGICGCDVHGISGRNFLRFTAGGSATHSDHGREICHTLHTVKPDGDYQVKDPEKLIRIAKEWGVETEGKDIYDLAHEVSELALLEYGKPFGVQRWLSRAPKKTQEIWHREGIEPRAIDREVSTAMHMTHMGCSSLPEALIRQALRCGLSDGWGGSMCGTEFSDVMFGTPMPIDTEANLGVMEKDMVNIIVHGHEMCIRDRFSIPYTGALAVLKQSVALGDFSEEPLKNPEVLKLASKFTYEVNEHWGKEEGMNTEIAVRLQDGTIYYLSLIHIFADYLTSLGLKNEFYTPDGSHDWYYVDTMIKKAIFEAFPIREVAY